MKRGGRPAGPSAPLPVLDEARCTGAAACVEVCPTQCLAMGPHVPWMPRPADCASCGLCVRVCPAEALRMMEAAPEGA